MAFFPLLSVMKTSGFCTVYNYPPNDWEESDSGSKMLWALYSNGKKWVSRYLCSIKEGEKKTIFYDEFKLNKELNFSPIVVLQLRKTPLSDELDELPDQEFIFNKIPDWRSTVGFRLNEAQASYQGEINPFPKKATLLTFHPFIQYKKTNNYFVFLNLETSPVVRKCYLEIYKSSSKEFIDKIEIKSCHANVIPIDKYAFEPNELPLFICREMGGIPFGFGISYNDDMLSLEHTHPPASFSVHGERFEVQKKIKSLWFNELSLNNESKI